MLVTICGIAATDSLMFNYSTSNEKLQVSGASLKIIGQYLYTEYQDVVVIMGILLLIATIGIVTMVIDFTKKPRLQVKVSEQLARDPKDSLTIVSVPFGSGVDY